MKQVRWSSQEQADYIAQLRRDLTLLQISVLLNAVALIVLISGLLKHG
jgi:hypothetical protein